MSLTDDLRRFNLEMGILPPPLLSNQPNLVSGSRNIFVLSRVQKKATIQESGRNL